MLLCSECCHKVIPTLLQLTLCCLCSLAAGQGVWCDPHAQPGGWALHSFLEQGPEPPSFPGLSLLLCAEPVIQPCWDFLILVCLRQGRDSAATGVDATLILNLFLDKLIPWQEVQLSWLFPFFPKDQMRMKSLISALVFSCGAELFKPLCWELLRRSLANAWSLRAKNLAQK